MIIWASPAVSLYPRVGVPIHSELLAQHVAAVVQPLPLSLKPLAIHLWRWRWRNGLLDAGRLTESAALEKLLWTAAYA